jgi:hypothetical protein
LKPFTKVKGFLFLRGKPAFMRKNKKPLAALPPRASMPGPRLLFKIHEVILQNSPPLSRVKTKKPLAALPPRASMPSPLLLFKITK